MSAQSYDDRVFDRPEKRKFMRDEADYVIVGTGPSGSTAAKVLSEAGHDVIMIEEGRWIKPEEFDGTAYTAQKLAYRDMGTIAAMGKTVIPLIQGKCVGGGSVINAAIIWRLPSDVYDKWNDQFGIEEAFKWSDLEESFDTLEKDLNVKPVSDNVLGNNNLFPKNGADKLGLDSRIIPRNEKGCKGSAQCLTGCPHNAKQSTDITYVPQALEKGARLYHSCAAEHIDVQAKEAKIVRATFKDPLTGEKRGTFAAHAKKGIILCCSPIQTPMLLWRSGIGLSSGHLGQHLMGHPGSGIMAFFKDPVRLWEGATQGWDSEHYRKNERVKFESLGLVPDLLAARIPGVGREFKEVIKKYEYIGNIGCALVSEAEGRVRPFGKSTMISYGPTKKDMIQLRKGLKLVAEIMVAGGAETIMPGIYGIDSFLDKDEINKIDKAPVKQKSYTMIMTHLFGTCRMGKDPRQSVVNTDFQVHGTKGLYILDSSIFPTNLGVNPQHTIMAIAMAGAKKIGAA
jgi:choline dehydrogenase-like flavoprotein